jgi:hypothetical protein
MHLLPETRIPKKVTALAFQCKQNVSLCPKQEERVSVCPERKITNAKE